jgi:phosphinothricin acetyltransferase
MSEAAIVRRCERTDVPALLDIYNYYVLKTPITFDIEPRTLEQRYAWFDGFAGSGRYQCFVALKGAVLIGWASSGRFKDRAAYDLSIETTVYVKPEETGKGVGRLLYQTLFAALADSDAHRAYAGITVPNDASERLHRAFGFYRYGMTREVGRKFGRYWDVAWYEKPLP